MIAIKFQRGIKPQPKGITPRRLKAAERALVKQQQKYPLLQDWVKSHQPTPEQRITKADENLTALFQRLRNHDAQCWHESRKQLRLLSPSLRHQLVTQWNNSSCPKTGTYFADFLHIQLKKLNQEEMTMLPLFSNYLNNLQSEITDFEQKLTQKKQEVEKLNTLQSQVGKALETLQNVVNTLKEVDEKAMNMLKETALSLFQVSSKIHDNESDTQAESETNSQDSYSMIQTSEDSQPSDEYVNQKVVTEITEDITKTMPNQTAYQSDSEGEKTMIEDKEEVIFMSDRVLYETNSEITFIAFEDKSLAKRLKALFKAKNIGCEWKIEQACYAKTDYELIIYELDQNEALDIAQNLEKYLAESRQSIPKPQSQFLFNQKVQIIGGKCQEFIGLIGKVASRINDNGGAYIQFANGVTKYFWQEELQVVSV